MENSSSYKNKSFQRIKNEKKNKKKEKGTWKLDKWGFAIKKLAEVLYRVSKYNIVSPWLKQNIKFRFYVLAINGRSVVVSLNCSVVSA